jgi:hypothetical protein
MSAKYPQFQNIKGDRTKDESDREAPFNRTFLIVFASAFRAKPTAIDKLSRPIQTQQKFLRMSPDLFA